MEDSKAGDRRKGKKSFKSDIAMPLALLYSRGGDTMEKEISSHRWLLANCGRHEVAASSVISTTI